MQLQAPGQILIDHYHPLRSNSQFELSQQSSSPQHGFSRQQPAHPMLTLAQNNQ
ncbi:hypothetical protein CPter291_3206 [Collimonas pratensis]|uniref:Uncharacterized protein n=1 Tax=Collimonas pratensis TaxID=279113 RepID=A0ABM5Z945_9BURK|nr:hypothetical protein CPter291_3206 [Collimonas pratensis]